VIITTHTSQVLIYGCNYPKLIVFYIMANTMYFLYLFGAFYKRTYRSIKEA
jgi:hypothetical protein